MVNAFFDRCGTMIPLEQQTRLLQMHDRQIGTQDIGDGLWFQIYSYLRCREGHYDFGAREGLGSLFLTIGLVSKELHAYLLRYVQLIPQDFRYLRGSQRVPKLLWACKRRIALGSVDFWDVSSTFDYSLCMYMIRSCSIINLRSFQIGMTSKEGVGSFSRFKSKYPHVAKELSWPYTVLDFQRDFAAHIPTQAANSLEYMHISMFKHQPLHLPFLTNFASTLVNLSLGINGAGSQTKSGVLDDDLEGITEAIETLHSLRTLKLNASHLEVSFRIKSLSLRKVDMGMSYYGFWVDECICPSLDIFVCDYRVLDGQRNGLKPMFKVSDADIKESLKNHRAAFSAEHYSFVGFQVPSSCTILLHLVA